MNVPVRDILILRSRAFICRISVNHNNNRRKDFTRQIRIILISFLFNASAFTPFTTSKYYTEVGRLDCSAISPFEAVLPSTIQSFCTSGWYVITQSTAGMTLLMQFYESRRFVLA